MNRLARIFLSRNARIKIGTAWLSLCARIANYDPKKCMNMHYKSVFHEDINWENPKNLIEKINWLQLNTDTTLWTICADKYRVREYIEQNGCKSCLNELYGKWDNVDDIEFDMLPDSFVLKANHGCGEVIIVKNKNIINKDEVKKKMRGWLKDNYGRLNGQTHYTRIKPCIIAEKYLSDGNANGVSIMDYKIWCFNGIPSFVLVCYDRSGHNLKSSTYDINWNNISDIVYNKKSPFYCGKDILKPENFEEMLDIARKLSKNFKEVRVDLYNVNGKIIFGELTFTTGFGYFTPEFYEELGSKFTVQ